ncbi:hypothetical protein [Mesorhizobium sp. M0664]|uniref:ATP-dependent DNA ligase n=1 Tax=unclassified Mesorhizobium TaxID=325217 RepID=UPI003336B430
MHSADRAQAGPEAPEGEHWIHEIKLDGYRTQIVVNSPDDIRVFTKPAGDWTSKYTGLVEAARELEVKKVEGEAVVTNEAGLHDFAALQKAVQRPLRHDPRRLRHHAMSTATIYAPSAARRAAKSCSASSSRIAGSSSARRYPAIRRPSFISPTRRGWTRRSRIHPRAGSTYPSLVSAQAAIHNSASSR